MEHKLKIFAIVVTYNGESWIRKCLNSLQDSHVPISIIVLDNCSFDSTTTIISEEFPEIELILNNSNLGFGAANNRGIKIALQEKADYILLINQDAWINTDTLGELLNCHKINSKYGILSPIHFSRNQNSLDSNFAQYLNPKQPPDSFNDLKKQYSNENHAEIHFVNAAIWLISKECLLNVGGFDPLFFHYGEDDDYINRLHYHNYKVVLCLTAYGWHVRDNYNASNEITYQLKKLRSRELALALVQLKNINKNLLHTFLFLISKFSLLALKFFFLADFLKSYHYGTIPISILKRSKKVIKSRKASKKRGCTFLDLKPS